MRDYRNIFNKVVPYQTDNSMSLYEFVGRLYEYIKSFEGTLDEAHEKIDEFTTYITSDIEEFKTSTTGEIADFIDRFDVQLDETTAQILREWKDDGTLEQIISLVWESKADKVYVDNLINQTVNDLIDNYTQADEDLRDQINASVGASIDHVQGLITDNTQEIARVEGGLGTLDTIIKGVGNRVAIQFINDSVLEYAKNMTGNFQVIRCSSPTDVPSNYQYSSGVILRRDENFANVILYSDHVSSKSIHNVHYNGEWQGWEEIGGSETALDILEKIKGVDGSGSGLDADTVDGVHGNQLSQITHTHDMSGFYPKLGSAIMQGADTPSKFVNLYSVDGEYRYVFTTEFGNGNYAQFSLPYANDQAYQNYIAFRVRYGTSSNDPQWNAWQKLYPTKHGTGNPPTLQVGEIYLKY